MGLYDVTLQDVIRKNATFRPEATTVVCGENRWSYREFADQAYRFAAGLSARGMGKGDRIAVVALNCHEYLLVYAAAALLGAIVLPINWRLKPEEIRAILEDGEPRALITDPENRRLFEESAEGCSSMELKLTMGGEMHGFQSLQQVAREDAGLTPAEVAWDDPFVIIYTAAVGGLPKGAIVTQGNFVSTCLQFITLMGMNPESVYLNMLPLFHMGGLVMCLPVMVTGGRNVIMKKFEAGKAVELIEQEGVTLIETFPPMLASILDEAEATGSKMASLKEACGIESPETIQRFQRATGARFWVGFGQTETLGYCTFSPFDEKPGSAGREVPLAEVRIVDDFDRPVSTDSPGEIVVKGPIVFRGYWRLPEDTRNTFRGGWHHTGDVGRLDDQGFLHYLGRKAEKELIKPGGENVYPAEVEKVLLEHPAVKEACVFGIPDPKWGEAVKAVCVLHQGEALASQTLIDFVAEKIARYKKPKHVAFVAGLPKGADGLIDRKKVKEEHV